LEALLTFLKSSKIPVAYINIGNCSKDDVVHCLKNLSFDDPKKNKLEYACVLAFDVKISPEAQYFADNNHIKIFSAKIIYHLFDRFKEHLVEVKEYRKKHEGKLAVFPCIIQVKI
jgi:translation initiation factor 5B